MRKLNRLTMTLALLIMAATGAWAQSTLNVVEIEVPANWETDENPVTAGDLTGFKAASNLDDAKAWGASTDGFVVLFYAFNGDDASYIFFNNGKFNYETTTPFKKDLVFSNSKSGVKYFYTAESTEWSLTPDETGKTWTLDKMPASNIELQVEYYTESNLFLSKDALADKASIAVTAGELGVQFGEDGKSANTVTEGTAMTVTYNGTKKVIGMKAVKKGAPKPETMEFVEFTSGTKKVKFANMNLGATSVADGTTSYGDFYAWGATEPFGIVDYTTVPRKVTATEGHDGGYTEANGPYYSGGTYSKYNSTDNRITLEAADDAVTAKMGEGYRMPTSEDFQTLYAACGGTGDKIIDKLPTIEDGAEYNKGIYWVSASAAEPVKAGNDTYKTIGTLFVQDADHHIFFPAAGKVDGLESYDVETRGSYWASSRFTKWNSFDSGYYMSLGNDLVIPAVDALRYYGMSIRPVQVTE